MMEEDFQSLSKGVFVIPFQASDSNQAGPSRPRRPLKDVYTATYERYVRAHEEYEASRTSEQLDEIADWLERCSAPPLLKRVMAVHRLPVAVIQNISASLPPLLSGISRYIHTIHGRDVGDISSAVRAVAVGFVGESALTLKKSGRTGIDEVERWWMGLKDRSPLLLHIQQAQSMSPTALSELLYIFTLHPTLPIRILLSVPSVSTFITSWTHIEPSAIDLSILQGGRNSRKKGGGVNAILKTALDPNTVPFTVSEELAGDLLKEDEMVGGGAAGMLKALRWLLLRQSVDSPLNTLMLDPVTSSEQMESLSNLQRIVDTVRQESGSQDIPGRDLLQIHPDLDLSSTQNPAPRIAILHALSRPSAFMPTFSKPKATASTKASHPSTSRVAVHDRPEDVEMTEQDNSPASRKSRRIEKMVPTDSMALSGEKRKSHKESSTSPPVSLANSAEARSAEKLSEKRNKGNEGTTEKGCVEAGEEYKELKILFELWRSAGKSVNLWDWLEGFRASMEDHHGGDEQEGDKEEVQQDGGDVAMEGVDDLTRRRSRKRKYEEELTSDGDRDHGENGQGKEAKDGREQARLHAIFIRFCEEARMLGIVRARGKVVGRRGDEVVKGVGLI